MIALIFDTESTGIKTPENPTFKPALVQLAAIMQDTETKRVLAEVNVLAWQSEKIPPQATAIHGITDEMCIMYGVSIPTIDVLFSGLVHNADQIVAHNLAYDMDIVTDNLPLTLQAMNGKRLFCTMDSNVMIVKAPLSEKQKVYFTSKGVKPDMPYKVPSLIETYQHYFGRTFEGAHDAMADVRTCRDVYFAMRNK